MGNEKQYIFSDLLEILRQYILNENNEYDWAIRLIIVGIFSLFLLFIFIYYLRSGSKILHTLKNTFNNDFFYPAGFVYFIILLESFLRFLMNNSSDYRFYIFSFTTFPIYLFVKWVLKKLIPKIKSNSKFKINDIFYNICTVSIMIFIICEFPVKEFSVHHLLFEITAIFFTFFIYFTREVISENKKANSSEEKFWDTYKAKLSGANKKIIAINTEKYSEFTDSIGYRYFSEQLKVLGEQSKNNLIKQRFFIISAKNPKYSDEILSFSTEKLSDKTRNFKSLYILHSLFGIEMYLIPKHKVKEIIKKNSKWLICKLWNIYIQRTWKKLDRLIIDADYYEPNDRGNSLTFVPNNKNYYIIDQLISDCTKDEYNVEKLKNIESKPNDLILEINELKKQLTT